MGLLLGLVFFVGMVFWYFYIAKFLIHKMYGVKHKLEDIMPPMGKGLFVATVFNIPSFYIGKIPSYKITPDEASMLGLAGLVITILGFYFGGLFAAKTINGKNGEPIGKWKGFGLMTLSMIILILSLKILTVFLVGLQHI